MVKYATRKRLAVLAAAGMTALAFGLYPASAADQSAATPLYAGISASAPQTATEKKGSFDMTQHIQSFVTKGTITQSQADILKAAVQNAMNERKQSASARHQEWTSLKAQLTKQAGLTQAQSDAVFPAPPAKGSVPQAKAGAQAGPRMQNPEARLQSLVKDGTITADQASVLTEGFHQNALSRQNDMKAFQEKEAADKTAAAQKAGLSTEVMNQIFPGPGFFPPHQKQAGMHRNAYRMRADKIHALTTAGTITQKQADQLNSALIDFDQTVRSQQNTQIKAAMDLREKAAKDAHVSPAVVDEVFPFHHAYKNRGAAHPAAGQAAKTAAVSAAPAAGAKSQDVSPAERIQKLVSNGTLNEKQADVLKGYADKMDSQRQADRLAAEKTMEQARAQLVKASGVSADVVSQVLAPSHAGPRR